MLSLVPSSVQLKFSGIDVVTVSGAHFDTVVIPDQCIPVHAKAHGVIRRPYTFRNIKIESGNFPYRYVRFLGTRRKGKIHLVIRDGGAGRSGNIRTGFDAKNDIVLAGFKSCIREIIDSRTQLELFPGP